MHNSWTSDTNSISLSPAVVRRISLNASVSSDLRGPVWPNATQHIVSAEHQTVDPQGLTHHGRHRARGHRRRGVRRRRMDRARAVSGAWAHDTGGRRAWQCPIPQQSVHRLDRMPDDFCDALALERDKPPVFVIVTDSRTGQFSVPSILAGYLKFKAREGV
jgi:hypothetical protein